jgi:predicted TIM-barrel enzyme
MREVNFRRENVKEQMAQNRYVDNWQSAVGATMALADVLNIEFQGEDNDSNTGV